MEKDFEKLYHDLEKDHFWFKARRRYISSLLNNFNRNISILDIGCSSGILLKELTEVGFDVKNLYGVDISEKAISLCKENGLENTFVMDAQNITLEKKFDVIIASDCLEHLQDDSKALGNWYQLLKDSGVLFVFVPAFMALWSQHDVVNMHYRRYTRKNLRKKVIEKGFAIEKSSYWNFFLFIPTFLFRLFSKLSVSKKMSTYGNLEKPILFNNLLLHLIGFENKILKFINFPLGISTFCVAKKNK